MAFVDSAVVFTDEDEDEDAELRMGCKETGAVTGRGGVGWLDGVDED